MGGLFNVPGLALREQHALPFGSQKLARVGIARLVPEMQAAIAAASAAPFYAQARGAKGDAFIFRPQRLDEILAPILVLALACFPEFGRLCGAIELEPRPSLLGSAFSRRTTV